MSMISSCFLVKVHNSQLYVNILSKWLLNILSLVCFEVTFTRYEAIAHAFGVFTRNLFLFHIGYSIYVVIVRQNVNVGEDFRARALSLKLQAIPNNSYGFDEKRSV